MTRRTVDYLILYVRDLDRAVAFYADVVGLPLRLRRSGYAEFATANLKFALYERGPVSLIAESPAPQRPGPGGHRLP